jgi:hypothetical protein
MPSSNPITIKILDIIHCPIFYLEHNVSEIGFCLRLQVVPTYLNQVDIARQRENSVSEKL